MEQMQGREYERVRAVVASRIRELRQGRGLSQEELADRAGVHRTYVGMLERQLANPSLHVLAKIAEALEVSVEDLCTDSTVRPDG